MRQQRIPIVVIESARLFDTVRQALLPSKLSAMPTRRDRNRPRRLAWPRTSPFHGGNTGSNPVGDANLINHLQIPSRIL